MRWVTVICLASLLVASCSDTKHDFGSGRGGAGGSDGGDSGNQTAGRNQVMTGGDHASAGVTSGGDLNAGGAGPDAGATNHAGEIGEAGHAGAMGCGDGNVDAGEQCDDGVNNGPGKSCNASCKRNVCGDGDPGPGEGCDKGADNGLELLLCAPDCSRIIEAKHIKIGPEHQGGNLQPNPVGTADASCPPGYKALFAYGAQRRATTTPNKLSNPIDWVLRPYTYYVTETENPIWLTDSVPLLGVRNGKFVGLVNRIGEATLLTLTGLNADWTTLATDNCNGWSSTNDGYMKHYGFVYAKDIGFLYDDATNGCSYTAAFYCVEQ